jgi:hypothetical protein
VFLGLASCLGLVTKNTRGNVRLRGEQAATEQGADKC